MALTPDGKSHYYRALSTAGSSISPEISLISRKTRFGAGFLTPLLKVKSNEANDPEIERHVLMNFGVVPKPLKFHLPQDHRMVIGPHRIAVGLHLQLARFHFSRREDVINPES